jgi:hypothetical protein
MRYSTSAVHIEFGISFKLVGRKRVAHRTPGGIDHLSERRCRFVMVTDRRWDRIEERLRADGQV